MKNHITCLLALLAGIGGTYYLVTKNACGLDSISPARCKLRTSMRKLWSDHVWWTRNYLISAIADLPDLKATTARLLKNQDDIGAAVAGYYGKEAGEKLAGLLKEHILIAADVVAAAKANNTQKLKDSDAKWHANADDIAAFLSSANPNWSKEDLKSMLYEHLKLTTEETVAKLKKEWTTDIATFDKVFEQALMMADDLTEGIVKQFPKKF